jgi:hypothetical protein
MSENPLRGVADSVEQLARTRGPIDDGDVRRELAGAGLPESLWKDVLALARPSLSYKEGRYHYAAVSERVRAEQTARADVRAVINRLIEEEQRVAIDRRRQDRIDFVRAVKVVTEDGRALTLLTRDLSPTGIRLVGGRGLLGQKVRVLMPMGGGGTLDLQVRVLWTCPVGDDLIENGGALLSAVTQGPTA